MRREKITSDSPGVVYLITNTVNRKIYVGKTQYSLKVRWRCHLDSVKGNSKRPFHCAIRKYGKERFKLEVLAHAPANELSAMEIIWIALLNSRTPNGYNLTIGGDGVAGHVFNEASRKRMSDFRRLNPHSGTFKKGHQVSEEVRKKISARTKVAMANLSKVARNRMLESSSAITPAKLLSYERRRGKPGPKHSAETRAKIKASHNTPEMLALKSKNSKGHKLSSDARERIRLSTLGNKRGTANKGRKLSKEQVEKMRVRALGNQHAIGHVFKPDDSYRKKMSEIKTGFKHSKETIEKLKAIQSAPEIIAKKRRIARKINLSSLGVEARKK